MKTIGAIVPAAGCSQRMGAFKPLLELNGFAMIQLAVQSALDGGASVACVVCGRETAAVQAALAPLGQGPQATVAPLGREPLGREPPAALDHTQLLFAENPAYAQTDMLASVQAGLAKLLASPAPGNQALDAIFVLPGDMPGIPPQTFTALAAAFVGDDAPILTPAYDGQRGHPLLIPARFFDTVLTFAGEGGLCAALAHCPWREVPVPNEGCLLDADTPQAFEALEGYVRRTRGVSAQVVEELFATHNTPANVQAHTRAVGALAWRMAARLNHCGVGLDTELCRSGGQLHDLNRTQRDHSQVAAANLRAAGYEALAAVVAAHDQKLCLEPRPFTEANLVFLADKLVKETYVVSLAQRYAGALKRFPLTTDLGQLIEHDRIQAGKLLAAYQELTGDVIVPDDTSAVDWKTLRAHHQRAQ